MNLNKVMLVGNVVRDPELRHTPKGTAVANVSLAVNERFTSDGEERTSTVFVDVSIFGTPAENLKKLVSKGTELFVEGALRLDKWQDKQTGQDRSRIAVNGLRWDFTQRLSHNVAQVPESRNQALVHSLNPEGVDR